LTGLSTENYRELTLKYNQSAIKAILTLTCALLGVFFFLGFYPGALVYDTARVISASVASRPLFNDPPIYPMLFSTALSLNVGVAPVLFIQLAGYWGSVLVYSLMLLKSG
jgi:hypothetical protein